MTTYNARKGAYEPLIANGYLANPPQKGDVIKVYKMGELLLYGRCLKVYYCEKDMQQKVFIEQIQEPLFKDIKRFYSHKLVTI